jgi:uncharacterized protein YkwD
VLGCLTAIVLAAVLASTRFAPAQTTLDSEELAFVQLINNYRQQNGLAPLQISLALTNAAKWMSQDMGTKGYFPGDHVDSLGRDPYQRMAAFGYGYAVAKGENIAAGNATAQATFDQWRNSPGHNANMLYSGFLTMGIGRACVSGSPYGCYWTNDFGGFVDQTINTAALALNSLTPLAGPTSGGKQIKLAGSFANLSSVTLGGSAASWSYSNGTSEITVTIPAHAVGAVDIVLTPTSGNAITKSNAFAYLPTSFTDNILIAGSTTAKAQHITELRQAVDAMRAAAGLSGAPWTDPTPQPMSTVIKAVHITELRAFLEDAAGRLGYSPAATYSDPKLSSGYVIKRVHIEELRQRIRNIAG